MLFRHLHISTGDCYHQISTGVCCYVISCYDQISTICCSRCYKISTGSCYQISSGSCCYKISTNYCYQILSVRVVTRYRQVIVVIRYRQLLVVTRYRRVPAVTPGVLPVPMSEYVWQFPVHLSSRVDAEHRQSDM
jgi:hypothetical protein